MAVLRQEISQFWIPAILPDNGSRLVGMPGRNPEGSWNPAAFENILGRGIGPVNSRPCRPRTGGKPERLFRAMGRYVGLSGCIGRR